MIRRGCTFGDVPRSRVDVLISGRCVRVLLHCMYTAKPMVGAWNGIISAFVLQYGKNIICETPTIPDVGSLIGTN